VSRPRTVARLPHLSTVSVVRPADGPLRRRTQAALVGAALVAVTGLVWSMTSRTPADPQVESGGPTGEQALALGVGSRPVECAVDYKLRRDTGTSFAASVTVANTGRDAIDGWQLVFAFPGDQRVSRGSGGFWQQSGQQVQVKPTAGHKRLAPGESARLSVTGAYRDANPLPVVFRVNDQECQAVVSGVSGGMAAGAGTTQDDDSSGSGKSGSSGSNSGKGKGKGKSKEDD
jgi:serine/threonine-protein kinase